ncbi:MAG: hypothetical protein ACRDNG_02685 [Gaiellaceae bacterium]
MLAITAFAFALLVFSVIPWESMIDLAPETDPYTHEPIENDFWWSLSWWFPELTALFIVAAVVVGLVAGYGEKEITGTSPIINTGIAFIIPSSSGHATLAMPLLAPLGDFADVSRPLVVTAWSWGAGVARFITPTSATVLAGIALAGVRYDK